MGLGPDHAINLADARLKAEKLRRHLVEERDPLQVREEGRQARKLEAAKTVSFKECAETYIKAHAPGWRNAKHGDQWRNTLTTYAYPIIGELAVQGIDTSLVVKVLQQIWETKTETATRRSGRIEVHPGLGNRAQFPQGRQPGSVKGHLDKLLPRLGPKSRGGASPLPSRSRKWAGS